MREACLSSTEEVSGAVAFSIPAPAILCNELTPRFGDLTPVGDSEPVGGTAVTNTEQGRAGPFTEA